MKPPPFEYAPRAPSTKRWPSLARHGDRAKVLAGGQSLVPLLNFRLAQPEVLVDINRVAELAYIRHGDGLAIGALTRQHAVERSATVRGPLPILAEACRLIGHLPIRHRGTVGGSLAHADPASELPAVMVALEAELTLAGRAVARTVTADQFFAGPSPRRSSRRSSSTEIRVPGPAAAHGRRVRRDGAPRRRLRARRRRGARHARRGRPLSRGPGSPCAAPVPRPIRAREAERCADRRAARTGACSTRPPRRCARGHRARRATSMRSADFRQKLARHVARQAIELAAERAQEVPDHDRRPCAIGLTVNGDPRTSSPSSRAGCWSTVCGRISGSPAPTSAASTACAGRARCWSTARPSGRA